MQSAILMPIPAKKAALATMPGAGGGACRMPQTATAVISKSPTRTVADAKNHAASFRRFHDGVSPTPASSRVARRRVRRSSRRGARRQSTATGEGGRKGGGEGRRMVATAIPRRESDRVRDNTSSRCRGS